MADVDELTKQLKNSFSFQSERSFEEQLKSLDPAQKEVKISALGA